MESDWRYFRSLVPRVRERYIAERIEEIKALLAQADKTPTVCFWEAFEAAERETHVLRRCLDGHSRTKMWLFLGEMVRSGMLRREDLHGFTPELQNSLIALFDDASG